MYFPSGCLSSLGALLGSISNTVFLPYVFVNKVHIVGKNCFRLFFEADNGI